jgi:hypothetical protein
VNRASRTAIAVALVSAASAAAADKPPASGTFAYNGKKYAASTAVAWRQDPFLKVVVSDKPFDPAYAKDGAYDDSELMAHPSASLTITIDAERRELVGIRLRDDRGSGADFRCEGPGLLTLAKSAPASITGTFKCEEYDVSFDVPFLAAPKPAAR